MPHPTRRNQPGLPSKPKASKKPAKLSDQIDQFTQRANSISKVVRFYEEYPKLAGGLTLVAVAALALGLFSNDKKG